MRNHSLRFLLGVFSLVSFAGCDSISQPSIDWSSYLAGEYYKTPSELEKEVDNNEVAFERKYKNKIIYVSGWVRNIDKDSFQVANRYYFYNDLAGISVEQVATIHCSVREESRRYIPELNSREAVVAVGRVDYSGGGVFDTIVLDDCIWGDKNNADTIGGAKLDIKNSKTFAHYNQILKAEHNKKLMDKRKKELEHEENVRVYDQSIDREIKLSTNAIQRNPRDGKAYLNRARAKSQAEDFQGALEDSYKALEIDPKNFRRNNGSVWKQIYEIKYHYLNDRKGGCAALEKAILFSWGGVREMNKDSYEENCD